MSSKGFRLYLGAAVLVIFVAMPWVRHGLQQQTIEQDIQSIGVDYSMHGPASFRARLEEVVRRAQLDPKEVKISTREDKHTSSVAVEIRYLSRFKILFFPVERRVVIEKKIPLIPLE